jgi:hypothetical protein
MNRIDEIIKRIKNGELKIHITSSGDIFINQANGEDIESYSILPYDDDPYHTGGWYIIGPSPSLPEDINDEDVEKFALLVEMSQRFF